MSKSDLQLIIEFADFSLRNAAKQAEASKGFVMWLDNIEAKISLMVLLSSLPDGDQKQQAISQLRALDEQAAAVRASRQVAAKKDLAHEETYHEPLCQIIQISISTMTPNKSPEPTGVTAAFYPRSRGWFHIVVRPWLSFFR
jgi:hypothetical protein